jgi:hypothetical protein
MNSVSSIAVYNATKTIENAPWDVSGAALPVHYAFLRRLGKVARLDMRFLKEEEATLPSGALIQLPTGYRPISIAQVYSGNWAGDFSPLIAQIQNDGWLSIFGDVDKTVSRIDFYIGISFLLP